MREEGLERLLADLMEAAGPCAHEVKAAKLMAILGALAAREGGTLSLTADELEAVTGRPLVVTYLQGVGVRAQLGKRETRH